MLLLLSNGAWAGISPDYDHDTNVPNALNPAEIAEGEEFFIMAFYANDGVQNNGVYWNPRWVGVSDPIIPGSEELYTHVAENYGGEPAKHSNFLFTIEKAEGKYVNGLQAYYLKHSKSGTYCRKNDDENALHNGMNRGDKKLAYVVLTDDKSKATPFAFTTQGGGFKTTDEGSRFAPNTYLIICYANDGVTQVHWNSGIYTFNRYGAQVNRPGTSVWNSGDCTFNLVKAIDDPDYEEEYDVIDDFMALWDKAAEYAQDFNEEGYPVIYGSDQPGDYPTAVAEEYAAIVTAANVDDLFIREYEEHIEIDWDGLVERLTQLLIDLKAGTNPLLDNYYYIVNAFDQWTDPTARFSAYEDYTGGIRSGLWKALEEENPRFIWQVAKTGEGTYSLQNYYTGDYLTGIVGFGNNPANITFTALGGGQFNIQNLHAANHQEGIGTSGTLVSYGGEKGTPSAWTFVAVAQETLDKLADEVAQARTAIEFQTKLRNDIDSIGAMIRPAYEWEITEDAKDVTPTQVEDFRSNWGRLIPANGDIGYDWGDDGSGFIGLIDDDPNTYFHAHYNGNPTNSDYDETGQPIGVPSTLSNLGMRLSEPASKVAFEFYPRQSNTLAQPLKIDVQASHDGVEWKTITYGWMFYYVPDYTADNAQIYNSVTGAFDLGEDYEWVRFCVYDNSRDKVAPRTWNLSKLKVYTDARLKSDAPAAAINKEVEDAFLKAFSDANKYYDILLPEDLDAARAALDALYGPAEAFFGSFANPAELKAKIAEAEEVLAGFVQEPGVIGTYAADADSKALENILANAQALLNSLKYTSEQLQDQVDIINEELKSLSAKIQMPEEGKWYQFRFPSEAEYDANPTWLRNEAEKNIWDDATGARIEGADPHDALYDRVAAVMDGDAATPVYYPEELREGTGLAGVAMFAAHEEDLDNEDYSLFRFIKREDGLYIIQNKATGLYIPKLLDRGGDNPVTLSAYPGAFRVDPLGKACCFIESADFFTGKLNGTNNDDATPALAHKVHFTWKNNFIQSYPDQVIGTKCSFHIVEKADVADDATGSLYRDVEYDRAYGISFLTGVDEIKNAAMYEVEGLFTIEEEQFISLAKVEKIDAGQPAIIIPEDEVISIHFADGYSLEPGSKNGLTAVFKQKTAEIGSATLQIDDESDEFNWFVVIDGETPTEVRTVAAYSAYLNMVQPEDLPVVEDDTDRLLIPLKGSLLPTSVKSVGIATTQDVYNMKGYKVGTTSDLKNLQRGIYILGNGKKLLIP